MASPAKFQCSTPKFNLRIHLNLKSPQNLSSPLFFRDLAKSTKVKFPVIRASSSSSNPKPSLLKTAWITLTAAAALFSASFYFVSKPPLSAAEEATLETESNEKEALLSLVKINFESEKYNQAIEILNRLIEIDPNEQQWLVMKARILWYQSERESAIEAFEEILAKDPNRVDAYHYLVMGYFGSIPKLSELENRINEAIGRCEKEKKTKEIRDFKLLVAQIRVMKGDIVEAIRICEELRKDDPEDFRIYLFQGMVYKLMEKEDEAAKQFKLGSMVLPENHPFREYAKTNTNNDLEWRIIVAYDDFLCYSATFTMLFIASWFGKFGRV